MSHLIDISDLPVDTIFSLINRALWFKKTQEYPIYKKAIVTNLFYENSTRTRVSFEIAAKNLSMQVINVDIALSSESKGETAADTLANIAAMGSQLFVIRHVKNDFVHLLAQKFGSFPKIINAGTGMSSHPSQALLDAMTIFEKHPDLTQLKIAIVGNIRHSRVANSLQQLFKLLKVRELMLVSPPLWQPQTPYFGKVTHSLAEGLRNADVIICLRVQEERLGANETLPLDEYHHQYGITAKTIHLAKPNALIMHPGPINRGVEMDDEIADGPNSLILTQVTNGVFMRMAILEALFLGEPQAS